MPYSVYIHAHSRHCHISLVEHYHVSSCYFEKVKTRCLNKCDKFNVQAHTNKHCHDKFGKVLLCSSAFFAFWKLAAIAANKANLALSPYIGI